MVHGFFQLVLRNGGSAMFIGRNKELNALDKLLGLALTLLMITCSSSLVHFLSVSILLFVRLLLWTCRDLNPE